MFFFPRQFSSVKETRMGGFDEKGQKVSEVVKQILITVCLLCFLVGGVSSCLSHSYAGAKEDYLAGGVQTQHKVIKTYQHYNTFHVVIDVKGKEKDVFTKKHIFSLIKTGEIVTVVDAEEQPMLLLELTSEESSFWLNRYLSTGLLILSIVIGLYLYKIRDKS